MRAKITTTGNTAAAAPALANAMVPTFEKTLESIPRRTTMPTQVPIQEPIHQIGASVANDKNQRASRAPLKREVRSRDILRIAHQIAAIAARKVQVQNGTSTPGPNGPCHHHILMGAPYQLSIHRSFFSVRTGTGGRAFSPPTIQRRVSAGSMTSSSAGPAPWLIALPRA